MKRLWLLLILLPSLAFAQDVTGGASAIDGDTLEIHGTIGDIINTVSANECHNYFANSGYEPN